MVVTDDSGIDISFLEKLIVNHAVIPDYIGKCVNAIYHRESFPPVSELANMWDRHVDKYHKLLVIKKSKGKIPDRTKNIYNQNYCGKTRLRLTYLR
jgi:hypothetical protein